MLSTDPDWISLLRGPGLIRASFGMRLAMRDGTILRSVDHDEVKSLDILGGFGSEVFDPFIGIGAASAVAQGSNLEPDIFDFRGFLDDNGITFDDIRFGRLSDADWWFFLFHWADTATYPVVPIKAGRLGEIKYEDDFQLNFRSMLDYMENNPVRIITADCGFSFMDPDTCKLPRVAGTWAATTAYILDNPRSAALRDHVIPLTSPGNFSFRVKEDAGGTSGGSEPTWPTTLDGEVTDGGVTWIAEYRRWLTGVTLSAVADASTFTTDLTTHPAGDDFLVDGWIEVETGIQAGVREPIEAFNSTTGEITLYRPLEEPLTASDTISVAAGCNKTMNAGTFSCAAYHNQNQYGGWNHMGGDRTLLKVTRTR